MWHAASSRPLRDATSIITVVIIQIDPILRLRISIHYKMQGCHHIYCQQTAGNNNNNSSSSTVHTKCQNAHQQVMGGGRNTAHELAEGCSCRYSAHRSAEGYSCTSSAHYVAEGYSCKYSAHHVAESYSCKYSAHHNAWGYSRKYSAHHMAEGYSCNCSAHCMAEGYSCNCSAHHNPEGYSCILLTVWQFACFQCSEVRDKNSPLHLLSGALCIVCLQSETWDLNLLTFNAPMSLRAIYERASKRVHTFTSRPTTYGHYQPANTMLKLIKLWAVTGAPCARPCAWAPTPLKMSHMNIVWETVLSFID